MAPILRALKGAGKARVRMLIAGLAVSALAACGDAGSSVPPTDMESTTTTLGARSSVGCIGRKGEFIGEQPTGPGSATVTAALQSLTTPEVVRQLRSARINSTTEVFGGYSPSGVLVALFSVTQLPDSTYYVSASENCVGYKSMMSPRH